ncbi:hypothetical protein FGO68_gene14321 [Halteria grandinella]|uniref:MORN repeat protein n=1 Tax=Halteria grandinella TaxID=5974 RepID=A0A8J8NXE5_HALGN|nr:hypothetical protein FGO68_gene14321 [Halteria grandinella]
MTQTVLKFGWKWSLDELNSYADKNKAIELNTFEGGKTTGNGYVLQHGVYYGQTVDGKRHGIGMVYCTSNNGSNQWLFECQWQNGAPSNEGRYIQTWNNGWNKWEGTMDGAYTLTGNGSYIDYSGNKYEGGWKQGNYHGQGNYCNSGGNTYEGDWESGYKQGKGKYITSSGQIYEGDWVKHEFSGQGRLTQPDGSYCEGEWKDWKQIGWHNQYTTDGVYSNRVDLSPKK